MIDCSSCCAAWRPKSIDGWFNSCSVVYTYTYIYIYIYTHITYTYTYLVRHGNRQDLLWFPSSTTSNVSFYGFRRWFFGYGFRRCFCCYFRRGRKTFVYGFRRWIVGGFCRRRRIQHFRMYRAIPRCVCF